MLEVASPPPLRREYTAVNVFDFDGTLFRSPMPSSKLWNSHLVTKLRMQPSDLGFGWFQEVITLSPPFVPSEPSIDWWNEELLPVVKNSMDDPQSYTVLLTGRSVAYTHVISNLVEHAGLRFDSMGFKDSAERTIDFKTRFLVEVLRRVLPQKCPGAPLQLNIWEDRPSQAAQFRAFFQGYSAELQRRRMKKLRKKERRRAEKGKAEASLQEKGEDDKKVQGKGKQNQTTTGAVKGEEETVVEHEDGEEETVLKVTVHDVYLEDKEMLPEHEKEVVEHLLEKYGAGWELQPDVVEYTAVFLDADSRQRLLTLFPPPLGWTPKADHMTMTLGPIVQGKTFRHYFCYHSNSNTSASSLSSNRKQAYSNNKEKDKAEVTEKDTGSTSSSTENESPQDLMAAGDKDIGELELDHFDTETKDVNCVASANEEQQEQSASTLEENVGAASSSQKCIEDPRLQHYYALEREVKMEVIALGQSEHAAAVLVLTDAPTNNAVPHITLAVSPIGKPVHSNEIPEWREVDVEGKLGQVIFCLHGGRLHPPLPSLLLHGVEDSEFPSSAPVSTKGKRILLVGRVGEQKVTGVRKIKREVKSATAEGTSREVLKVNYGSLLKKHHPTIQGKQIASAVPLLKRWIDEKLKALKPQPPAEQQQGQELASSSNDAAILLQELEEFVAKLSLST
ncbi:Protein-lysine N-methyltransferase efm5 [Balamuthia mandrillaris]